MENVKWEQDQKGDYRLNFKLNDNSELAISLLSMDDSLTDLIIHHSSDHKVDDMTLYLKTPIEHAKNIVENSIKHFNKLENNNFTMKDMEQHILVSLDQSSIIDQENNQQQQTTNTIKHNPKELEKMGRVQGVCEALVAIGNEASTFFGKKILTEMKVTHEDCKKYAKPETYKELEKTIFAPKQEHKLEQTQGVRR